MYTETQAQLCPVCKGKGVLMEEDCWTSASSVKITKTCHGCDGKGWVVIQLDYVTDFRSK